MTSQGRRIDWRDLGKVQDGGMIEVGFRMKGGGVKRKTKTGTHWESLASGGESEGSEETERSGRDGTEDDMYAEVLEDVLNKVKVEGWAHVRDDRNIGGARTTGRGRDDALVRGYDA